MLKLVLLIAVSGVLGLAWGQTEGELPPGLTNK
jgi:hypothetical protein